MTLRSRLGLLAVCAVIEAMGQDAASLYREGVDRQRQGDFAGAVEFYKKSLNQDGTNVAARSNLGAALVGLGRYDDAIPEYQAALRDAPEQVRPQLQRNLALAYYKSGRMREAAPLLIGLHEARPSDRDATLLAADCLLQSGEAARALGLLEPLARDAASDRSVAYALGIAYLKTGKTAEAQRVLDPILKDTSSAEGNYALGVAMFSSGDYPAAVRALQRAVELNGSLPHLQSYYGQALRITGDGDGALEAFGKQRAEDANDFEANLEPAAILCRRKRYTEAEPLLRHAIVLRPQSAEAHLSLADALNGEGKRDEARSELESTVAAWPKFGAAHARLAELYASAGLKAAASRERALASENTVADTAVEKGPKKGSLAPHFRLQKSEGGGAVELPLPAPGKPAVLVFGSYTCPNFRKAASTLDGLSKEFGGRVSFLLVYIREAHPTGEWQSTINEREHVELAAADSAKQKAEHAAMCQRKLHLAFAAAVDGLDNAAEQAYEAWPSRVYVISAQGRVLYASALIEEEFDAAALRAAVNSATR